MIKYNANDFFMIRTPLLSTNDYLLMFDNVSEIDMKKNLKDKFKEPFLNETLAVASNDLLEALDRTDITDSSKSSDQVTSSLIKYFIRLSTRPTPFGLFSGISMGEFDKESKIIISEKSQHTKRARVDMEWLYGVIKEIESNPKIKNELKVIFNDYTFINGNRIEKPNKTFLEHNEAGHDVQELSTTVRYTSQVKLVENLCQKPQKLSFLISFISEKNPNVPVERIEKFIIQLFENEFLISELRPPIINTDILDYVIGVLSNIKNNVDVDYYLTKLNEIRNNISKYNSQSIGSGQDILDKTIYMMKDIYKCKNYLQIDMKVSTEANILDESVREELEQFINAMCKITPEYNTSNDMDKYIKIFNEKYGYRSEVPVLELLDTDKGIGSPEDYIGDGINIISPIRKNSLKEIRIDLLKERKILSAIKENKKIVELTDDDIDYIAGEEFQSFSNKTCLKSLELFLIAHPNNPNYSFTLAPSLGSNGIGKTFGRFTDLFTVNENKFIEDAFKIKKEYSSEYIIAEISELPINGRTSNVSLTNSDYDYQITLTSNYTDEKIPISIKDLYIGIDKNNFFYIKSKKLNKKVIVTMTNMLNTRNSSPVLKFLTKISLDCQINVLNGISMLRNMECEYSPRIVYKRIIIKPETWIISKDILKMSSNKKDEFIKKFNLYREKWHIPRYVYLARFDNRILMDIENPMHIDQIYKVVKKDTMQTTLYEMECDFNNNVAVDGKGNHYITEIVVPFMLSSKNRDIQKEDSKIINTKSDISLNCMKINRDELILLPGKENWIFYKLYGYGKRQNEMIAYIYDFLEQFANYGIVQKYFFIRYSDPKPHLRLRIQAKEGFLTSLFENMNKLLENFKNKGFISEVLIDSYKRETERYGGPDLIREAEEYFCHESHLIMKTMNKFLGSYEEEIDYIGISFIISTLKAFGLTRDRQQMFLDSMNFEDISKTREYRKLLQKNRDTYMGAVNDDNWKTIRSLIEYPDIYNLITETYTGLRKYAEAVYEIDKQGEITNTIENIISSIIHMFCNRFVGNNIWERKIYSLARDGLRSLQGYLKYNS
jgi:thiopeptide-type bacteriocin biosynthesis protein